MNFDVSEEQQLLQDTVRSFLEGECPIARVRELFESETGFDPALWKGMLELGLGGLLLPEEHGGAGLEMIDLALVAETLGYGGAPGPFLGHSLAGLALRLGGSDAQKQSWLPRLASGDVLATLALGEEHGAWGPEQWRLPAAAKLSGEKTWVPHAAEADLLVVGVEGGGLSLVERSAPGIEVEPAEGVDRSRRLDHVRFAGAAAEPLAKGVAAAPRLRDAGLVLLAADAFGAGAKLLDLCVAHAKSREQFGVTIGHFQALKHQLADMAVDVEPCRALFWYAAHAFDHVPEDAERAAALAKAHVTERAMQVARDSVEAHGGIGFTWECDVQIWFKRAMFDRAFLGTPSVHRERCAKLAGW